MPTQGAGQQPQGQPQQPKKAGPKVDSRLIPPTSPVLPRTSSTSAPAAATTAAPAAAPAAAPGGLPTGSTHAAASGLGNEGESGQQQVVPAAQQELNASALQRPSHVKQESVSRANSPNLLHQGQKVLDKEAASEAARAASGVALHTQGTLSGPAGMIGRSLGDAVRDKALAILGLALTSPVELTPQEAAVALEEAVFIQFSEQGAAGMRSVKLPSSSPFPFHHIHLFKTLLSLCIMRRAVDQVMTLHLQSSHLVMRLQHPHH